jgi:HEAT repeat protein
MRRTLWLCVFTLGGLGLLWPSSAVQAQYQKFLNKDAATWAKDLKSKDVKARRSAAFALGKMGENAAPYLSQLIGAVNDTKEDASVREEAAFALGDICRKFPTAASAPMVAAYQKVLSNPNENALLRRSAAYGLGSIGPAAANALNELDGATADKSPAVRQNVAWALGQIGKSGVVSLTKLLKAEADPSVVRDTANSLRRIGKDARPAVPDLLRYCGKFDKEPAQVEMRKSVLFALVGLITKADKDNAAAVDAIAKSLDDPESEVRRNAALALANIGETPKSGEALKVLLETLKSPKEEAVYRRQAAVAVGNLGPIAKAAVPDLLLALNGNDAEMKANAAFALGGIRDKSAVAALAKIVGDTNETLKARTNAAVALRDIGSQPEARPELVAQIPTLVKVLEDPKDNSEIRTLVLWPFRFFDENAVKQNPAILDAMEKIVSTETKTEPTKMLHYDSACLLGRFKGKEISPAAMKTLTEFLKDDKVLIYRGTSGTASGGSAEAGTGGTSVQKAGYGDGRIIVIQALTYVGMERVAADQQMIKLMRALADGEKTDPPLKKLTKQVMGDWGL